MATKAEGPAHADQRRAPDQTPDTRRRKCFPASLLRPNAATRFFLPRAHRKTFLQRTKMRHGKKSAPKRVALPNRSGLHQARMRNALVGFVPCGLLPRQIYLASGEVA